MGIRHLTRHLQPYAESELLHGQEIVIDGPAFCYHVYNICLSARKTARNPLEAAILYDELGLVAIAWLDALCASKVSIRKIYFDGFLPSSKLDVRISRLIVYTQKLLLYHSTYPTVPCRIPFPSSESGLQNLFPPQDVRRNLTTLPSVPFLVPAILEALVASDAYQNVTEVVPAEADLYCAQALKVRPGIVLTSDSDLLIHDLGIGSAVSFFKDIEPVPSDADGNLQSRIYHPDLIASRLGLARSYGLRALAFEMHNDPHESIWKLIAQAKILEAINSQPEKYEKFIREYEFLSTQPVISVETSMLAVLKILDPRVSEYVLQFPFIATIACQHPESSVSNLAPHIFLPFLFDYPLRTNAWEISRQVRQLAYGLVNLIAPEDQRKPTVVEHRRQEERSGGRELHLPDISQIPEACSSLVSILEQLRDKLPPLLSSEMDLWTAVAVYQNTEWSHHNSKSTLSQLAIQQLPLFEDKLKPEKNLRWEILQFHAQIQGSFHSFRILKQIISLLTAQNSTDSLPPSVLQLHEKLQLLPPLSRLPDISQVVLIIRRIKNAAMVAVSQEILGIAPSEIPATPRVSRKAAKKGRKEERRRTNHKVSNNPFQLLETA